MNGSFNRVQTFIFLGKEIDSLIFKVKQAKPVEVKRLGTEMSYCQDSR